MHERDDDRLWQGALPLDLERVRAAASRLPLPPEPDWDAPRARPPSSHAAARPRVWLALAAAFVALIGVVLIARDAWRVDVIAGRPALSGIAFAGRVALGGTLSTDATSRARLEVTGLGDVTLEPGGRLRRVRGRGAERRLELERGTLQATIIAPPRLFVVGTSVGSAVDLGCAYTLTVDDSGKGRLEVTFGRVMFEDRGHESLLPSGLWCPLTSAGAGVPRRVDASDVFLAAVAVTDNPNCQADDFTPLLVSAEANDAITLWHLLPRVRGEVRRQVAERIASLIEVPHDVTVDRVLALDPAALEAWWNALGVGTLEEWRGSGGGLKAPEKAGKFVR
jgi:hypothetical protein